MTLDTAHSKEIYHGNGTATVFPFAFTVWGTGQVLVTRSLPGQLGETDVTAQCTITLSENGGTVIYLYEGAPLPSGATLAITRNMPFTQGVDLVSASRFDPQVIEDALDQATAERQQVKEMLARAVILPSTSDETPQEVVQGVYAARDDAANSAAAASESEGAAAASASNAATSAGQAGAEADRAKAEADRAQSIADVGPAEANKLGLVKIGDGINVEEDGTISAQVASSTQRGMSRSATIDDLTSGLPPSDGPAFLAVGSEALNAFVPTFMIGCVIPMFAADGYVPNGCVLPDGTEYMQSQFPTFYTDYLVAGRIVTCTYAEFAAQVALTGNCGKFALDQDNHKFKVPLQKDGDSITAAVSASEVGKSIKAGLPNVRQEITSWVAGTQHGHLRRNSTVSAPWYKGTEVPGSVSGDASSGSAGNALGIDLSLFNDIFGSSDTVTTEGVRLRHFVVLASAQNNASMFDWSAYMSALAGKANTDLDNISTAAKLEIKKAALQKTKLSECTTSGAWTITGCRTDMPLEIIADIITTTSGGNNGATIRVTSGADGGTGSGDGYFGLGRGTGWFSSDSFVCYPTSSTVVINVAAITTVRLTAKQ